MDKTLLEKVLDLPPIERVEFAQLILASLEVEDKSVKKAWIKEVERRIIDYKSGKSKLIDFREITSKKHTNYNDIYFYCAGWTNLRLFWLDRYRKR